jgi:hypothetical protein
MNMEIGNITESCDRKSRERSGVDDDDTEATEVMAPYFVLSRRKERVSPTEVTQRERTLEQGKRTRPIPSN